MDLDYDHLPLQFFNRWLKGIESGWTDEPPVKIFVMGGGTGRKGCQGRLDHGGHWRDETECPLTQAHITPFYLCPDGHLSDRAPREVHPPNCYLFDPNYPVPTVEGNISSGQPIMQPVGFDQRKTLGFYGCRPPYLPLASRPDVKVFETDPLAEDLEVSGPLAVHLWIVSTAVGRKAGSPRKIRACL